MMRQVVVMFVAIAQLVSLNSFSFQRMMTLKSPFSGLSILRKHSSDIASSVALKMAVTDAPPKVDSMSGMFTNSSPGLLFYKYRKSILHF